MGAPARHHYSVLTIVATLQLYLHTGLGSRGVRRVLGLVAPWPTPQAPGSSTVFNWLYRGGLALLQQAPERCGDWIYVIDHTLGLGETKCIPVSRLAACGYSPPQQAMKGLAVEVTSHSTGTWVAAVLAPDKRAHGRAGADRRRPWQRPEQGHASRSARPRSGRGPCSVWPRLHAPKPPVSLIRSQHAPD
jgi:hypothetical protein